MQDDLRPNALTRTSVHEASHVVVAVLHRRQLRFATVTPDGASLGRTVFISASTFPSDAVVVDLREDDDVETMMTILLAGFAGEILLDQRTNPGGCEDDIWRAWLLGEAAGRDQVFFVNIMQRAVRLLKAVWPCVLAVAVELQRRGTIDGASLRRLVQRELGLRRRWRHHKCLPDLHGRWQ